MQAALLHAGMNAARLRTVNASLRRIDGLSWLAMICLAVGWFGLDTLVGVLGPVRHAAHFYELPALILDPQRLLFGLDPSFSAGLALFGLLCLAIIPLPLLPRMGFMTGKWLLLSAPLLWMVLCGSVLYLKASAAHIAAPQGMGRLGGYLASWANGTLDWAGDVVARHITIGPGAYLALLGGAWLLVRGAGELRASKTPAVTGPTPTGASFRESGLDGAPGQGRGE
ncbi:MAG TPA: hypothetical protein VGL55_00040 [Steroidobacteraceae bacterium]|jgi:hypothetical protein